jgi:pyruvate kinase
MGPACDDAQTIRQLILEGVDIFRLNFAHGSHEWLKDVLQRIRTVSDELKTPVGVLGDLSGPKIRLGRIAGDELTCSKGQTIRFVLSRESDETYDLTCTYEKLIDDVKPGDRILLADGMSRGNTHSGVNIPILLAGKSGGTMKTSRHIQAQEKT